MLQIRNLYKHPSITIRHMGQNSDYVKRDKLDILLGILNIANITVKKTHILYKANINFYQLTRYLNLLRELKMLEEVTEPFNRFRTTEKGRTMLDLFNCNNLKNKDSELQQVVS